MLPPGSQQVRKIAFIVLSITGFLVIGLLALVLIRASYYTRKSAGQVSSTFPTPTSVSRNPSADGSSVKTTTLAEIQSNGSLSIVDIPAFGGQAQTRTTFTSRVKEVKRFQFQNQDSLLYIANPDIAELGDAIILRTLADRKEQTIYSPPEKFFIDSYIFSSDGTSIFIWLISPTLDGFKGGISRIIQIASPNTPRAHAERILLEESITGPTHFPLFWSKTTNRLYLGTFTPGKPMNQGLFSLDVESGKLRLEGGEGGLRYSANPLVSPSGRWIVYTFQTAKQVSNLPPVGNGFISSEERNSNAIAVYDLVNGAVKIVDENTSGGIYVNPIWSEAEDSVFWQELQSVDGKLTPAAFWKYTLSTSIKRRVGASGEGELIADIGQGVLLLGIRTAPVGTVGALRGATSPIFGSYYLLYPDNKYIKVYIEKNSQVIGIQD